MSKYDDKERAWRKEYNQRPEVKVRQKQHIKKYLDNPEVKERVREYNRDYFRDYWKKHPDKYQEHKQRVVDANRARTERKKAFANKNPPLQNQNQSQILTQN